MPRRPGIYGNGYVFSWTSPQRREGKPLLNLRQGYTGLPPAPTTCKGLRLGPPAQALGTHDVAVTLSQRSNGCGRWFQPIVIRYFRACSASVMPMAFALSQ